MDRDELIAAVEGKLYDLICAGGGDGDTIRDMAEEIADLMLDANRKAD